MYSNPPMDYAYHTPSSHQWSIPPTYSTPTPTSSFPSFPWELFTPYYTHGSSSPKFYLNHGYSPHTPTSYPPPPNPFSSYPISHYSPDYNNSYQFQNPTNNSSILGPKFQTHSSNRRGFEKYLHMFPPCFKKYSQKSSKTILTKSKSTNTTKPLFTLSFKNPISDIIISHKNQTSPQKNYVFIDDDKPREECGVVGIYGDSEASRLCYLALHALQHSGQEGAEIVTVNNNILQSITGSGLVSDVFNESNPNQSYNPATYCDSDFSIDNGVSCLPIPPEKGKQIVSELIKKSELNLKKGNQVLRVSNDDDKETLDLCRKSPKGETLDQISATKETKAETEEIEEASLFQLPSEVTPGPSDKLMSMVGFDFCNESCIVSRTYSCNLEKDTTHYGRYEKGGIVALSDPGNFILSDFSKFDRPPLLHLAFQALVKFTYELGRFPIPGVEDDAQKLIAIASHMNDISGDEKIDDINPKLLQQFAFETRAVLNPMAAMFGGIVGQEVVKACSGKFPPGPFNDDKFHVDVDFLVPPKSPDFNLDYANSVLPPPAPTTVYSRYESQQFSLNILSRIPSQFILNSKNSFNFQVMITLGKYFVMVDQIVAEFLCCGRSEYRKYTETGFSNIGHHMFVEIPLSIIQLLSAKPFPPKPPDPCFWLNNSTMLPPPSFKMWEYLIYKVTRCGIGYGLVPPKWRGNEACKIDHCITSPNATPFCNRKLIGARIFSKNYETRYGNLNTANLTVRDFIGHGTHILSTTAGNFSPDVTIFGNGTAKGCFPRARAASYKLSWSKTDVVGCHEADILEAFDHAINDGVVVISTSLGVSNPYFEVLFTYGISIGKFHVVAKNVVVVCSAGYDGHDASTVTNVFSWSVAASTIDSESVSHITIGCKQYIKGVSLSKGLPSGPTQKIYPILKFVLQIISDNLLFKQWDPGTISPLSYLFSNLEDKVQVDPAAMIESII